MLKKLRRSKFKGIKKELWMSLYSNQKRLRGSKKNWKKESTKLIWKQMGQERTKEESLFKVKETEQKQEQTEKRKYMMKLN